ncbi:hypothetical protein ACFDR9_001609 [Janthinobacterium sp. CG_23.3]|nr:hypothetical protein [Janthinobacterium sp. CG_S6]
MIRFLFTQYRLSCRAGFGRRKAIKRAISAYITGF